MNSWASPELSSLIAGSYLGLLSALWLLLIAGTERWGRKWVLHRPKLAREGEAILDIQPVLVSICIPARNEAENIGRCVAAALATAWKPLEVLVIDDGSDDGTADAAMAAADGDPRLRIIRGVEPPKGWAGKPWACSQGAGEAGGEVLCFVDADVRLAPEAVASLVEVLVSRKLGLVSAYGSWELLGFWERLLIPAVGWLIRGAVNLDLVNDPGRSEAFANGQCIAVVRNAYEEVGGHGIVREQILEDVRLAEQFKRRGHPVGMMVAPWAFTVRLYTGLGEIIAGYSKNLYEGLGRSPTVGAGAVLFIFVGALMPWLLLALSLVARMVWGWSVPTEPWIAWCAALCLLQVVFRWRLERRDGRSGALCWAHPLANVVLVWILLRSIFGMTAVWKGRSFVDGRAS